MVKCEVCNQNISVVFLDKIKGTVIKDSKGKKHFVCSECQKKHSVEELKNIFN